MDEFGIFIIGVLILGSVGMAAGSFKNHAHLNAKEQAKACIQKMFLDPDAYDPSAHFTIEAGSAPPYMGAIVWINDNLEECMK